jgi:hypothetical protein
MVLLQLEKRVPGFQDSRIQGFIRTPEARKPLEGSKLFRIVRPDPEKNNFLRVLGALAVHLSLLALYSNS